MKRNKIFLLLVGLFVCMSTYSQNTQKGYVKTRGRLGNNGSVISGQRLPGAAVILRGGNNVVSRNNGAFTLVLPNDKYHLQDVLKKGYVLSDPDILSKDYGYSKNPLVLVLEDTLQKESEYRAIKRKIRKNLDAQLEKRDAEIASLKEQNKISEDKYRELLQKFNADQDNSERLISEMADRYIKIDFDQLDEFNRRISDCIVNGRLAEADSLLRTKGDFDSRFEDVRKHQELNALAEQDLDMKRRKLEKSMAQARRKMEDLASDCYSKFEIFKLRHQNDSAAYFPRRISCSELYGRYSPVS
jgi:hypothetical protein